jgi:hypothetical protein
MIPGTDSLAAVLRQHSPSLVGTGTAWMGVLTANLATVEQWLRIASLVGALVASGFTVWGVLRRRK